MTARRLGERHHQRFDLSRQQPWAPVEKRDADVVAIGSIMDTPPAKVPNAPGTGAPAEAPPTDPPATGASTEAPKGTPFWRSPIAMTFITAFASAILPVTQAVTGHIEKERDLALQTKKQEHEIALQTKKQEHEIELERRKQDHEFRAEYLKEAIDPVRKPEDRQAILRFLSIALEDDPPLQKWANQELERVGEDINKPTKLKAALIDVNKQFAQTISGLEKGKDEPTFIRLEKQLFELGAERVRLRQLVDPSKESMDKYLNLWQEREYEQDTVKDQPNAKRLRQFCDFDSIVTTPSPPNDNRPCQADSAIGVPVSDLHNVGGKELHWNITNNYGKGLQTFACRCKRATF